MVKEIVEALQSTPTPTILVVAGIVFLLLSVVSQLTGGIAVHPERQRQAVIIGSLLLVVGIALNIAQPRWFSPKSPPSPPQTTYQRPQQTTSDLPNASLQKSTPNLMAQYPVTLASGTEINVGPLVYKILTAQLDRSDPDKFSLSFRIRLTTKNRYAALTHDSFRILVDGVPQAPEREPRLSEIVDSNSAKEGMVRFVIPDTDRDVKLQIIGQGVYSDEKPLIPINLKATKP
jgi:hypothetical protein